MNCVPVGGWSLGFIWSLELGTWNFHVVQQQRLGEPLYLVCSACSYACALSSRPFTRNTAQAHCCWARSMLAWPESSRMSAKPSVIRATALAGRASATAYSGSQTGGD